MLLRRSKKNTKKARWKNLGFAFKHPRKITFEIQDNGFGFPLEFPNQLIEPYKTTKTKGTGLGLTIVKKNVENHEGSLILEHRSEDGAIVRVNLPSRELEKRGVWHLKKLSDQIT